MPFLRRRSRLPHAAWLLLALLSFIPQTAHALEQTHPLRIGAPPEAATLRARSVAEGLSLELLGPRGNLRTVLPVGEAATLAVEALTLAGGAGVALVRVTDGDTQWVWIVSARARRPVLLFSERVDLVGERGERRGYRIEAADRTGDGVADIVVGIVREDTHLCGSAPALLAPRAIHPTRLALTPVTLRRLMESPQGAEATVSPSRTSPGPSTEPVVEALRFRRASSIAGAGERVLAPSGLDDGDTATAWIEGAASGDHEFATGAWGGGPDLPIRALSIVPRPTGPAAESTRAPAAVVFVTDGGARLRVPLPPDIAPGERLWIVPPRPLVTSCLSVVLDAGDDAPEDAHLAIAEIAAYSEADFGGGVGFLVGELSAGGARAERSERLLGGAGAPAVVALAAAFADMPATEQLRATRALARLARTEASALPALAEAALSPAPGVAEAARRALVELRIPGLEALATVATRDETGEALMELSRRSPRLAVGPMLDALASEGGGARPELRRALAGCLRSADPAVHAAVRARVESAPSPALAASLLESAAAAGAPGATLARQALGHALEAPSPSFDLRFRVARAASSLWEVLDTDAARAQLAGFLRAQASDAEEWMMRREALTALAAAGAPTEATALLVRALDDAYPRVRRTAIEALAPALPDDASTAVTVAKLARRDAFPLVRAEAVRALASVEAAHPVVLAALGDPAERVRAAAIAAFAGTADRRPWAEIEASLRSDDERPLVTDAAIEYTRTLCVAESVPALAAVVARGQRPGAWEPHRATAGRAIMALAHLGTPDAREVLERAARGPGQLMRDAAQALTRSAGCPAP